MLFKDGGLDELEGVKRGLPLCDKVKKTPIIVPRGDGRSMVGQKKFDTVQFLPVGSEQDCRRSCSRSLDFQVAAAILKKESNRSKMAMVGS